jgi:hypothetical protein
MTLLDMQRVFCRILTDKSFQLAFINGEEPASGRYQLTERELDSLRGLRWNRVGLHSDLLAHGRLELALKGLPLTSLLLHEQLHAQLDRFCAEYPPIPEPAGHLYLEAGRLSDFAVALLSEGVMRPWWAADLIAYERTMLTLALDPEVAESAATVAELNEAPVTGDIGDLIPVAGAHVKVLSFSCPLPGLLPGLDEGIVPESVPRLDEPLLVLFHKVSRGAVRMIRVNAAAAALADGCDGNQTVTGVVDRLTRHFGLGIEPQALGALGWLRENGVIGLRKGN